MSVKSVFCSLITRQFARFKFRDSLSLSYASRTATLVLVLVASPAFAAGPKFYVGPANGVSANWNSSANWSAASGGVGGAPVPIAGDTVSIVNTDGVSRAITYDFTTALANLTQLTINLTGGSGGATTTLSMSATNNILKAGSEYVGNSGAGTNGSGSFNQSAGANTITGVGSLYLANNPSDTGLYTLGGTGALSTTSGLEYIGYSGTGGLNQTGGTNSVEGNLIVGYNTTALGSYTLSSGTLSTDGLEYMGYFATGNLAQSKYGGTFTQTGGTNTSTNTIYLGYANNTSGSYLLSGGALSALIENIGYAGIGTFTQNGGTNTVTNGIGIAQVSTTSGTYVLSAGSLSSGNETVAINGTGLFNQTGGSNTITSGSSLYVGDNSGSTGTYLLGGSGALNTSGGTVYVGYDGTGTFTQNGVTNSSVGSLFVGYNSGSLGTYSLSNSANLSATYEEVGLSATGNLTANQYGGTFTQNGGTNAISSALVVGDSLHSSGSYTLNSGTINTTNAMEVIANSGTGTFIQTGGTNNAGGSLTVGYFATAVGSYTLSGTAALNSNALIVGHYGTGTFTQMGGTNSAAEIFLGYLGTASGTYNLSGGLVSASSDVYVGGGADAIIPGTGTFNVGGTGVVTVGGTLEVTNNTNSILNLNGGTINAAQLNFNGVPSALNWTSGKLNLTSSVTFDSAAIGTSTSAAFGGGLSLGSGQTLQITGSEVLGGAGPFSLMLNNGSAHYVNGGITLNPTGTFTQNTGSALYAASFVQAGGTVNGTLENQGSFVYQSGQFNGRLLNQGSVTFGASFTAGNGVENDTFMSVGSGQTLTVNGAGLENVGSLTLTGGTINGGSPAAGTLVTNDFSGTLQGYGNINAAFANSGVVSVNGELRLSGATAANNGVVRGTGIVVGNFTNAAGGTIQLTQTSPLAINGVNDSDLDGTLDWINSGLVTLSSGAVLGGTQIRNSGTIQGAGTVNSPVTNAGIVRALGGELDLGAAGNTNTVNGSIQAATGNTVMVLQGLATNVGTIALTGGAFDNNNHALSNSGIISGYGALRTAGLTSTGKLNIGEGNLDVLGAVINNGTIGIQGGRFAYFFGNVSGSGSYTGLGTPTFLAAVSPGNSPAAVSFSGGADLTSTSTLNIELGGIAPGTQYDQLLVAGQLTLGGALQVLLINGFTPTAGNQFNVLDWGTLSGTFSSISLPALSGGLAWNTSQLYTTGLLSVIVPGIPGDYNNNGAVDAADYVVWRANQGTSNVLANDSIGVTIGAAQFNQWRAHFGQAAGSGAGGIVNAAVPEPATFVLLIFAAAGWCLHRIRTA